MAKKRRTKREERPRSKVTFIFFHGDAMDLINALEAKIAESGLTMETVIRAVQASGVNLSTTNKPPTPQRPN